VTLSTSHSMVRLWFGPIAACSTGR
jgi:hypothetical protein